MLSVKESFALIICLMLIHTIIQVYALKRCRRKSRVLVNKTKLFQRHSARAKTRILILGDSSAMGVGATFAKNSIAGRFAKKFPRAHIENISKPAMRTKDIAPLLKQRKFDKYDLIVINAGVMDVRWFTPFKRIQKELKQLLALTKDSTKHIMLTTGGNVAVLPMVWWPLSAFTRYWQLKIRDIYATTSKKHGAIYVDIFDGASGKRWKENILKYVAKDKFHPNDHGYGMWFKQMNSEMKKNKIQL